MKEKNSMQIPEEDEQVMIICPVLFKKMLKMGNRDFKKEYQGFLVNCTIMKECNDE